MIHINKIWKSVLFSLLLLLFVCISGKYSAKAASSTIVPVNGSWIDDDSYPSDTSHLTTLGCRFKYEGGKIYAQVQAGTYRRTTKPYGYDHIWMKNSDGEVFYRIDLDRSRYIVDSKTSYEVNGYTLYLRDCEWVNVGGAAPEKPSASISSSSGKYYLNISGSSNEVSKIAYDYDWSSGSKYEFVPGDGQLAPLNDFLTGYYYSIDTNPSGDTSYSSPFTTTGQVDISSYINNATTYYVHIRARSYTGRISDKATYPIKKMGIKYHSEDGAHDVLIYYVKGTGACFSKANTWWKNQIPGNTWLGWSMTKDSKKVQFKESDRILDSAIDYYAGTIVDMYSVWEKPYTRIHYHSEDGTKDFILTYVKGCGKNLEKAGDWWKNQIPGNTWQGWSETKGARKVDYRDECPIKDAWIEAHTGKTVDLYSVWNTKVTIRLHSEDEKHNNVKSYELEAGGNITKATDWWKGQKPGYTWLGWSETKGARKVDYRDECPVADAWIKSHAGKTVDLYSVWNTKVTIRLHSEDEKHNNVKSYELEAGGNITKATDWWKGQKPGYTWLGWSETKGARKVDYRDECPVTDAWIEAHAGKTVDLYSVWDRPTATIAPTKENISFKCNGTTYYKAPVEFEVKASDKVFSISSVSIWSNKKGSLTKSFTSSYKKKFDESDCISPDKIRVYGKSTAGEGESETVNCDVYLDRTAPVISSNVMDYGSSIVKTSVTDSQSGVATVILEYLKNGTWNEKSHYDTKSTEYSSCDTRLSVGSTYYDCKHRIKAIDHLGNVAYSASFYVIPLQLTTALSKYNGETVYNGGILTFIAGGDLKATLKVKVSGYPDRIKYEYAPELGQATEEYNVTPNESGNVYETKTFTVPYTIAHDAKYSVKVTAYRDDELISTIEYVKMTDIDFSKFKSSILYQSGQHN